MRGRWWCAVCHRWITLGMEDPEGVRERHRSSREHRKNEEKIEEGKRLFEMPKRPPPHHGAEQP